MATKGYIEDKDMEAVNVIENSEKPLISSKNKSSRVDINILKSKLEKQQSKEFKKNFTIFSLCIFLLGAIGLYLSL
tara:strand:+ start:320 stop:547 length:228 start_codon:yes stop_codon:yes gene_type:complete